MPDVREHRRPKGEKRRATQKKSRFLRHAESNKGEIKKLKGKFTCNLEFCYFTVIFYVSWKKRQKNGERDGTRTRNIHRDRVAL